MKTKDKTITYDCLSARVIRCHGTPIAIVMRCGDAIWITEVDGGKIAEDEMHGSTPWPAEVAQLIGEALQELSI